MKKILLSIILFSCLFLLFNCSKQNATQPENTQGKTGSVLFKIDKANAPKGIVEITATLSRHEYDTLKSTMNLLSDSTSDLMVENIEIGTWHLKIDAKNSSGIVMYTGETDVNVQEKTTVQVNLTLLATGAGVGNIHIIVGWGNSLQWTDYSGNPVYSSTNDSYSPFGICCPKIIVDGPLMRMWYRNQGAAGTSTIGYAISEDGKNWTNPVNYPVLTPGNYGSWDSFAVTDGVVIKDGNNYRMYYRGTNVHSGYAAIGLATSTDCITWEKLNSPVLTPVGSETAIGPECVIKVNGTFYLYYNMMDNSNTVIGLATSMDGINWTRYSGNPILYPTQSWEGTTTDYPSVIYENNTFKMVYMLNYRSTGWALGKATSEDGKNWVKSNINPFFQGTQTSNNWAPKVVYPFLLKFNNEYRIYYACGDYPCKIGYAKSSAF